MLNELLPIQFIEGINENARYDYGEGLVDVSQINRAIEYKAGRSYCLTRLDLYIVTTALTKESDVAITLLTDYENNPTDIILSKGKFVPKLSGDKSSVYLWQEVILEPVVIIHDSRYWITIAQASLCLAGAKEGVECAIRARGENRWFTAEKSQRAKVMLRFYGRVLPLMS